MLYIAGIDLSDNFVLIDSDTLVRKILSSKELLDFLINGNKIWNISGEGKLMDKSSKDKIQAYSKEFYTYLNRVRDVYLLEDWSQNEFSFNINLRSNSLVLVIHITYSIREHTSEFYQVPGYDFYIVDIGGRVRIYSQGYGYELLITNESIKGVCFVDGRYVIYSGTSSKVVYEYVLRPDIDSVYIACTGETTLKAFKRRELLCGT